MRRAKVIIFPADALLELFTEGPPPLRRLIYPIPPGTRVLSAEYSPMRNGWLVCIEHETFADVPDGEMPPYEWARYEVRA